MAFVIVHHFPGGTKEQYEKSVKAAHPADGSLPAGQTHHYAGPTDDGWVVVAVFESEDDWNRFRDEELAPALQSTDGGLPGPPRQTGFEAHRAQTA